MRQVLKFIFVSLLFCACVVNPVNLKAQDIPTTTLTYTWPTISQPTPTGQLGKYLVLASTVLGPAINNYSIDWTVGGTAPSACTFRVEGSSDTVNWVGLDATAPSTNSCISSSGESVVYKPFPYVRVTLVSWTAGDNTSSVVFHFTGSKN